MNNNQKKIDWLLEAMMAYSLARRSNSKDQHKIISEIETTLCSMNDGSFQYDIQSGYYHIQIKIHREMDRMEMFAEDNSIEWKYRYGFKKKCWNGIYRKDQKPNNNSVTQYVLRQILNNQSVDLRKNIL